MSKHSPTPWEYGLAGDGNYRIGVIKHNGIIVCEIIRQSIMAEGEPEANATHIVTCVNACAEAGITKPEMLPTLVGATRLLVDGLALMAATGEAPGDA